MQQDAKAYHRLYCMKSLKMELFPQHEVLRFQSLLPYVQARSDVSAVG